MRSEREKYFLCVRVFYNPITNYILQMKNVFDMKVQNIHKRNKVI